MRLTRFTREFLSLTLLGGAVDSVPVICEVRGEVPAWTMHVPAASRGCHG